MKQATAPRPHTASYYAASMGSEPGYPALEGVVSTDVCVVGGGFTGVSTALTLAERGYRVVLLEANRIGWGASGRNGGQLIAGVSGEAKVRRRYGEDIADLLWKMRWLGNDIVHDRVAQYGIDCDLRNGYIEAALKPRQMRGLEAEHRELEARGHPYEFRLLDAAETRATLGTEAYIGSLITMRNGHLHPLKLCLGEARAAHSLGVQIHEGSRVTAIQHGARPRVVTAQGTVEADSVVLAGNAYHALERKHLSGLTFAAGSYIIATEPLPEAVRREINPLDLAVCDTNEIVDYYRLSADGRMLYGGRCNYSGRAPRDIAATIRPRMLKVYPRLQEFRIDYQWGGRIGIVLNRIPALGRINGNVYYVQGYCGHGVNATHIMGEVVADAIAGTMERFDVYERIRHFRIPGGQWFGNQLVALGMLYFRLKDLLP